MSSPCVASFLHIKFTNVLICINLHNIWRLIQTEFIVSVRELKFYNNLNILYRFFRLLFKYSAVIDNNNVIIFMLEMSSKESIVVRYVDTCV